ncbi:MAG: flavodoxin [Oscillospiraceae bacterium]|nr:flavodoxin [Oscillospiraceae bacterium]
MKELLFVDCCVRGEESRTKKLAQAFLNAVDQTKYHVTVINPEAEGMQPLTGAFFAQREKLLAQGALDHPRFRYAHQLAQADVVVFAAPFWDLSFPAILKVYIENVSVDGITFGCNAQGLYGACRGSRMVFLTTRGGYYSNSPLEQGSRYLEAIKDFFGFQSYSCIAAEGMDAEGSNPSVLLADACGRARGLAASL